jgi:hypothetical protein
MMAATILHVLVEVLMVSLIIFNQVFTVTAATELIDIESKDKAIKQELWSSRREEIKVYNIEKQEEEEENNGDTAGTLLEEDIMIDDNYSSDDDEPFELHFINIVPFPRSYLTIIIIIVFLIYIIYFLHFLSEPDIHT